MLENHQTTPKMTRCVECGCENPAWAFVCHQCNSALPGVPLQCLRCGKITKAPATHCASCQAPLQDPFVVGMAGLPDASDRFPVAFKVVTHAACLAIPVALLGGVLWVLQPPFLFWILLAGALGVLILYSLAGGWGWNTRASTAKRWEEDTEQLIDQLHANCCLETLALVWGGILLLPIWALIRNITANLWGIPLEQAAMPAWTAWWKN